MSGAEAGFVIGLISGVISIVEATKIVYDAAKDAQGQPEAFRQVAARLPLVLRILCSARARAQTLNEMEQEALEPILKSCKAKAEELQEVFHKVVRKDEDKWYDRYKKAAVGVLGKRNKVEDLMGDILKDIHVLACEKLTGTATDADMEEVSEAMKQMKDMPPSLSDETGDGVQQNHSGSGDNNAVTGQGTMNTHKGTGDMYHNQITGDAHFVDVRKPVYNVTNHWSQRDHPNLLEINCLKDLYCTDPRLDKERIEAANGGLLEDSYRWIFQSAEFLQWRDNQQSRLLWIKGNPGKGKTMLLCGIINELTMSPSKTDLLSYFFCQGTETRINNAVAVLRGLLYLLVTQQPSLISHIRKKHDYAGKALFEDTNAWFALCNIFADVLQDPNLSNTYLIIDALDECTVDLPRLLDFIAQHSSASPRVKWVVSSRNWPYIEEILAKTGQEVRLSLELSAESVSSAVDIFIQHKVLQLSQEKKYSIKTKEAVQDHLTSNAGGTFLWVALVCQSLMKVSERHVIKRLDTFPPGLNSLYERMMQQISNSDDADVCKEILSVTATAYRPVTLEELIALAERLEDVAYDYEAIQEIIGYCGSFLTLRENTIYFVHQSAKDFLLAKASHKIFPSGREKAHWVVFSRSVQVMSATLCRDMYDLREFGYPTELIQQPEPDPLAASRYSCIYWVDHLYDSGLSSFATSRASLQDGDVVDTFLRTRYLYWLEALSLCQNMSKGVVSIHKLAALIQETADASSLNGLVQDACRFIMYHKVAIENSPLQAYASALLFSPEHSLIKGLFRNEEPRGIIISPPLRNSWSACLQTLEDHCNWVNSVVFSPDSQWLASASRDNTIKIWDLSSGDCLRTLEGHSDWVNSVVFLPSSQQLASASRDMTIWDLSNGGCLRTLKGHKGGVRSVAFSSSSQRLASGSFDNTIKIWDYSSSNYLHKLESHSDWVNSVIILPDSHQLVSASADNTIKIWDPSSGDCLLTLQGHSNWVVSLAFLPTSRQIISASHDKTIKIWDLSNGDCLRTLEGHESGVRSVVLSPNSQRLASGSFDGTVKIWDPSNSTCLRTLKGHEGEVGSLAFTPDSQRLASGSAEGTIKIWDLSSGDSLQTYNVGKSVYNIAFNITGSFLQTDNGTIMINPLPVAKTSTGTEHRGPEYQGIALDPSGKWITLRSKNLLWLPSDYRPSCSTVSERMIGFGVSSGKVWMCKIDIDNY
ncbi:unnamed protein product [Periconia digitata]|uniref:Mitochondrial division protein 1 n=1 Tax=Periconia digitata TaxID=1303443 RepID=A0A9W4U259_9PLEO|nr:unnamed protein product [Periconia digitata]